MKKIIIGLVAGLAPISSALAGPPIGFVNMRITWTAGAGAGALPVPTLGTWGALLLAVVLALVVYRAMRKQDQWLRALAPLATFGLATSAVLMAERPEAGAAMIPPINGDTCSGSETYTVGVNPPPCFINTCGSSVTVSYTVLNGETPVGDPITSANCTYQYFCSDSEGTATDGSIVASDGSQLATAYCNEIGVGGPA